MANPRKVQGEIDKLVKKIDEGIVVYEDVYEKFQSAPNQAQKEKVEADLKKEIKKLQRLREQIKALLTGNEVKDKRQLEEKRREIEIKMEDFKVCERETKTKAYSKEGLANAKNDPADTPLARTEGWINDALSELQEQIETCEFEVINSGGAGAGGARKKRGGGKAGSGTDDPRVVRLNRLKTYALRLEQLLRMLVNEELEPEEVDDIEEAIGKFVEENDNEEYEPDDDMFDAFALPEISAKEDDDDETERERQKQAEIATKAEIAAKAAAASAAPQTTEKKAPVAVARPAEPVVAKDAVGGRVIVPEKKKDTMTRENTMTEPSTPPTKNQTPLQQASTPAQPPKAEPLPKKIETPQQAPKKTPLSPKVTAADVARGRPGTPPSALEDDGLGLDDDMDAANDDTFGDDFMPMPGTAGSLADLASMTATAGSRNTGDWGKGRPANLMPASAVPAVPASPAAPATPATPATTASPAATAAASPPAAKTATAVSSVASTAAAATPATAVPAASTPAAPAATTQPKANPLQILSQKQEEIKNINALLDISCRFLPTRDDVERVQATAPANPTETPESFPTNFFRGFRNPELLKRFESDTLFFMFYYQQSTFSQHFAARELRRQGFRYHTKFHTWFQRHDKPSMTTETFEQGSYVYFDYENGWCQRIKKDFQFKYTYLDEATD